MAEHGYNGDNHHNVSSHAGAPSAASDAVHVSQILAALHNRVASSMPAVIEAMKTHPIKQVQRRERPASARHATRPGTAQTGASTLIARLSNQVSSLRRELAASQARLVEANRALAEERRAATTGAASGGAGEPGAAVLTRELSRCHGELAKLEQRLRASQDGLARARARASAEAERAQAAEEARRAAEATAAAFEARCAEAEAALERLVAPKPVVGDEVEVQTKASLTAVRGAVRWKRGRVLSVRRVRQVVARSDAKALGADALDRDDGANAEQEEEEEEQRLLTVRFANGTVQQGVPDSKVLLRVPSRQEAASWSAARASVEARRRVDAVERRRHRSEGQETTQQAGSGKHGGSSSRDGGERSIHRGNSGNNNARSRWEEAEEGKKETLAAVRATLARGMGEKLLSFSSSPTAAAAAAKDEEEEEEEDDDRRRVRKTNDVEEEEEEESDDGGVRELVRSGRVVSDASSLSEGSDAVQAKWVWAVLERRCKQLASSNVRLRARLSAVLGAVRAREDGAGGDDDDDALWSD